MKTIFVDRDGVINEDCSDYVKSWSDFEFLPGSLEAIKLLTQNGCQVIVITNQSVINRKMLAEAELQEIHEKMKAAVLAYGGCLEKVYYCPHIPEDECNCRKPRPGLIRQAQADHGLNLSETCMVGDSLRDIECGRQAGCGKVILVRTGHGKRAERLCIDSGTKPDYVADDLLSAAEWLLAEDK